MCPPEQKYFPKIPLADVKVPENFPLKLKDYETHDFAMLILEQEVTFTAAIRPACIPKQVHRLVIVFWDKKNDINTYIFVPLTQDSKRTN